MKYIAMWRPNRSYGGEWRKTDTVAEAKSKVPKSARLYRIYEVDDEGCVDGMGSIHYKTHCKLLEEGGKDAVNH